MNERLAEARGRLPAGLGAHARAGRHGLRRDLSVPGRERHGRPDGAQDASRLGHAHAAALRARRERDQFVGRPHRSSTRSSSIPRRLESFGVTLHGACSRPLPPTTRRSAAASSSTGPNATPCAASAWSRTRTTSRHRGRRVDGVPVLVVGPGRGARRAPMPRQGAVTRDGRGESVAGMVIMLKGENGRDVGARVKARIAEVEPTLPGDVPHRAVLRPDRGHRPHGRHRARNLLEGSLLVVAGARSCSCATCARR